MLQSFHNACNKTLRFLWALNPRDPDQNSVQWLYSQCLNCILDRRWGKAGIDPWVLQASFIIFQRDPNLKPPISLCSPCKPIDPVNHWYNTINTPPPTPSKAGVTIQTFSFSRINLTRRHLSVKGAVQLTKTHCEPMLMKLRIKAAKASKYLVQSFNWILEAWWAISNHCVIWVCINSSISVFILDDVWSLCFVFWIF